MPDCEEALMANAIKRNLFSLVWRSLPMRMKRRLKPYISAGISGFLRQAGYGFIDFAGFLRHIKSNGFCPQTIIDVGANVGDWSRSASRVFPDAEYILIDGNSENREQLALAAKEIHNSEYLIALLGPKENAQVVFHVHGAGSSVLSELTSFNGQERVLPMIRLDDVMAGREARQPILLKIDVQGFELEVLRGASSMLNCAEVVILETALLPYNEGAPLFAEVISFMAESGLTVYDFCGEHRRESDNALFQSDIVFTKMNSHLRAKKKFWLHEP
jgi:FkbM family methyltransferase